MQSARRRGVTPGQHNIILHRPFHLHNYKCVICIRNGALHFTRNEHFRWCGMLPSPLGSTKPLRCKMRTICCYFLSCTQARPTFSRSDPLIWWSHYKTRANVLGPNLVVVLPQMKSLLAYYVITKLVDGITKRRVWPVCNWELKCSFLFVGGSYSPC